jgi:hypothetical protein
MGMCFYRSPMAIDSRMGFVIQSPLAIGSRQKKLCALCASTVNLISRRATRVKKPNEINQSTSNLDLTWIAIAVRYVHR